MAVNFLAHIIRTKGIVHALERSAQVLLRYTFGKKRFSEMMSSLEKDLGGRDVRVTFFITASLLGDHLSFFNRFKSNGHDLGAHGYFHTDMKMKTREEQRAIVLKSYRSFRDNNLDAQGFRCPYLSYNENTVNALKKSSFSWTSNDIILWEEINGDKRSEEHLRKLGLLYNKLNADTCMSLPKDSGKLVEIPITAPDDEMILERYRIRDSSVIEVIWLKILRKIYLRGELYHLLFHPERFIYVSGAIRSIVESARSLTPHVWFATLNEISLWWSERAKASWSSARTPEGRFVIKLEGPWDSTVLMKKTSDADPKLICGRYAEAGMSKTAPGEFRLETIEPWRHIIAISNRCPNEVERFLCEEGFFTTRTDRPRFGALFIDRPDTLSGKDKLKLLEEVDGSDFPLLRLWRWPHGAQCAFTISSDVDSVNLPDFFKRLVNF